MKKLCFILLLLSSVLRAQHDFKLETWPEKYGGRAEWKRFFHDHMVYPGADLAEKAEGTVKIAFRINRFGRAFDTKVVESVTTTVDQEALRLLSLLEWDLPAATDTLVTTVYTINIQFPLSRYKKWVKERGYVTTPYTELPVDSSLVIHESADKAPSFADPQKTFAEFVYANLEYPEMAKQQTIEGNVILTFVVEPNGSVSNIRIKKGLSGGCNDEATRVIGLTIWKPAQKNGKYVRYRMYYTMVFNLRNTLQDGTSGSQRPFGQ